MSGPLDGPTPSPSHNDIFEKFVDPEADDGALTVAGMIAYGLYKKDKRQWIIRFCSEKGRAPTPEEMADYRLGWNDTRLDNSRNTAQAVLGEFSSYVLLQERPKIIKEALRGRTVESIGLGLATNVVYTLILLVVVAGLASQGIDVLDVLQYFAPKAPQP